MGRPEGITIRLHPDRRRPAHGLAFRQKCRPASRYHAATPGPRDSIPRTRGVSTGVRGGGPGGRDGRRGGGGAGGAAGTAGGGAEMAKKKKKNSWIKNLQGFWAAVIAAIPLVVPAIVA